MATFRPTFIAFNYCTIFSLFCQLSFYMYKIKSCKIINTIMKIIGLQGIWSNGDSSVDRILNSCHGIGFDTKNYNYKISLFDTYNRTKLNKIVDCIEKDYTPGDIIVAHSAGCLLTLMLSERLLEKNTEISLIWFFNAALNNNIKIPKNITKIYNVCDKHDNVLWLAKILPSSTLGDMGRVGYKGANSAISNVYIKHKDDELLNHSDFFEDNLITTVSNMVIHTIQN